MSETDPQYYPQTDVIEYSRYSRKEASQMSLHINIKIYMCVCVHTYTYDGLETFKTEFSFLFPYL